MAHVRKYSFQMEVWPDLVNLSLFAHSDRKHAPPSVLCAHINICVHTYSVVPLPALSGMASCGASAGGLLCVRVQAHQHTEEMVVVPGERKARTFQCPDRNSKITQICGYAVC